MVRVLSIEKKYPKLSDANLKYDIVVWPQIRKIINDYLFEHMLKETGKSAWLTFKAVYLNFLGNLQVENYKELVKDLLNPCNMILKINFLYSHLDFFRPNLGLVGDEHGESFHHDISFVEKRYAGRESQNMLADCCWNLLKGCTLSVTSEWVT